MTVQAFDVSLDYSEWKRKFAWRPTKVESSRIIFQYYYERTATRKISILGVEFICDGQSRTERVKTLFDVLKA